MPLPLRDWLWRAPRVSCALPARLRCGGAAREVALINLSLSGAFVQLDGPPPLGERVALLLREASGSELELPGRVVRHGNARKPIRRGDLDELVVLVAGLGLEFDEPDDGPAGRLQDLLDALLEE